LEKQGKDNAPTYVAYAQALSKSATGVGKNKKAAEQFAARALLEELKKSSDDNS
jgi:dsRNA-specific ribonuclease